MSDSSPRKVERCPYCNDIAMLQWGGLATWGYVRCNHCQARGPFSPMPEAVDEWNEVARMVTAKTD